MENTIENLVIDLSSICDAADAACLNVPSKETSTLDRKLFYGQLCALHMALKHLMYRADEMVGAARMERLAKQVTPESGQESGACSQSKPTDGIRIEADQ